MTTDPGGPPLPLLFLSGAGFPEWIWDDVRSQFDPEQCSVVASRPSNPTASDLDGYAQQALIDAPERPFMIVAHSLGAVVGLRMVELAPGRVDRFLAISGVVPPPGGSFVSAMPYPNRLILDLVMRFAGTRPPDKAIRSTLAGVDPATIERILHDFTTEPRSLFRQRIDPTRRSVHTGYLHTSRDRELPMRLQNKFAENLEASWTSTIDAGHMPMLERPKATAETIEAFQEANPEARPR